MKGITAVCVLQFVDAGRIGLDEMVKHCLPAFNPNDDPLARVAEVRSGMPLQDSVERFVFNLIGMRFSVVRGGHRGRGGGRAPAVAAPCTTVI